VDTATIAALLRPFLEAPLREAQLANISTYIDLLLHWNARINLTAVRQPEEIVTRHFGESLFAARHLFVRLGTAKDLANDRLIDIGSGAGFPGLPIKLWAPEVHLTLIESSQKKATFLREVIRSLTLTNINVFATRAEDYPEASADVVTLRAVERFDAILPIATRLVAPRGRLALLIGQVQADRALTLAPEFGWPDPIPIPLSSNRVLLVGSRKD
jgi:16S rRNA (guanine527-N7)-methyltransferase